MTINISLPEEQSNLRPRISVIGVGGAGGNAVNNMMKSNLEGVDFLIANTDAQALENSACVRRVQLGLNSTKGLGAGMRPDIGKAAAEETLKDIELKLDECNMAFIAAGMGGGTGTGASPVIAKLAREKGILTVGVVTKPFHFEGLKRMAIAVQGIEDLEKEVDTLIIIPNQNLFRIANERTTWSDAFTMADDVLYAGVRGVTDLMVMPGLINLDFSDIKTVMSEMGKAMMGTGQGEGESRATDAAESAMANPLIDDVSLKGAKGLIINITGGKDLTLYEVDEAANRIREEVEVDANIIFGSTCDERLEGKMRVSIVATGIESKKISNSQISATKKPTNIDNSVYQKPMEKFNDSSNIVTQQKSDEGSYNNANNFPNVNNYNNNKDQTQHNSDNLSENIYADEHNDVDIPEEIHHNKNLDNNIEKDHVENQQEQNQYRNVSVHEKSETNTKRMSLFDVLEKPVKENNSNNEENVKKEPVLEHSNEENNNNDVALESEEHPDHEDHSTVADIDDDINQEEELLDVPTFLRRQAN